MTMTELFKKVVAIGDIGGHYDQLINTLVELGVDLERALIPAGLSVIQIGDLIHKGPRSDDIITLVDLLMNTNNHDPAQGNWYQCFGNHEMLHIPGGVQFGIYCDCSIETIRTLERWWTKKQAHIAIGIKHEYDFQREDFTVATHAGVTITWWRKACHQNGYSGAELVLFLNNLMDSAPKALNNAGIMLGGPSSFRASPIWAESSNEVYASWDEDYMPFSQIHGHTCSFIWDQKEWYRSVPLKFRAKHKSAFGLTTKPMKVDEVNRQVTMHNLGGGGTFYSIDPGFSNRAPMVKSVPYLEILNVEEIIV